MDRDEPKRPGKPELTCDYVRGVAEALGRDWVVLIAEAGDQSQFTTWGRNPADKVEAARISRAIADATHDGEGRTIESFVLDAARNKARAERLEAVLRGLLPLAERAGDLMPDLWGETVLPRLHAAMAEAKAAMEGKE